MSLPKTIRNDVESMKLVDLKDLHPFQGKLKDLSKENYRKLRSRIEELGFSEPFAVWKNKGRTFVLNGHQRLRTLQVMAGEGVLIPKLPAAFIRAKDEKEAKRKVLALTSQFGEMTGEGLFEFLTEAGIEWPEAKDSFRFPEIDFKRFESEFFTDPVVEDEVPEPPKVAITKPGDLWELGEHRLLCGDSTESRHVDADCVLTDPPYGQNQEGVPGDEPENLKKVVSAFSWLPGKTCVVFQSARTFTTLLDLARSCGWNFERVLWLYKKAQNSYPWRGWLLKSEAILVFSRDGGAWTDSHPYHHDTYEVSEVSGELPEGIGWHGSVKPVKVVGDLLSRIGSKDGVVCDPFCGSGTTLIAAEQLNRKCYAIEIEPKYCDVIISRWETLTGGKAKRASGHLGNVERATASRKRLEAKGVHL